MGPRLREGRAPTRDAPTGGGRDKRGGMGPRLREDTELGGLV